ncbi:MAG TPA: YecH family metal-binding protein [Opitutaceae bacterium]|nr:YecH family metal-binding protein [Opitutaceae bacterium]
MSPQVHGHEVIAMMLESRSAYTRESLAAAIVARFGADARFHTCSADGMTAPELIDFLAARGKFQPAGEGFALDPAQVCAH